MNSVDANFSFSIDDIANQDNPLVDTLSDMIPISEYYEIEQLANKKDSSNNSRYFCLHINIHSIPEKFDNLKTLITLFRDINITINFIFLCETFLNDATASRYNIPGYTLLCRNRTRMSKGGLLYILIMISHAKNLRILVSTLRVNLKQYLLKLPIKKIH